MSWKEFWKTAAMACIGGILVALTVLLIAGMFTLILG
jgi:hypothetical protein